MKRIAIRQQTLDEAEAEGNDRGPVVTFACNDAERSLLLWFQPLRTIIRVGDGWVTELVPESVTTDALLRDLRDLGNSRRQDYAPDVRPPTADILLAGDMLQDIEQQMVAGDYREDGWL